MAEQSQNPGAVTNSFTKGMVKDYNETFVGEGMWTHARNASNNSHEGHVGVLGNEPANLKCVQLPYALIGAILLRDDQWVIFTTDDTNSEIGIFDESKCLYTKTVNASCLNFKKSHLITGVARERFGCEDVVYWDDGINPSRILNLSNIPFKVTKTKDRENKDCIIETATNQLDCEQLRLSPLVKTPCFELKKGKSSGTLPNGSYQVAAAYAINQIRIGDYFTPSEIQSLFDHNNVSGSLEVNLSNLDQNFDEYELVIIYFANGIQTVKKLGTYSTNQTTVNIDTVDPRLEEVPFSLIPLRSQIYERSEAMYLVSNYLMRVGMYTKFDFNYQIQANKIKTKWVAVQYPADYYVKGGNNAGYMRDEQYAFFIRWIYNTGDKSASYHIPGRTARNNDLIDFTSKNTASVSSLSQSIIADGGLVIAEGEMGYWESTERYIDNKPEVWGELCGKPIRHHKFPDQTLHPNVSHYTPGGDSIIILGVKFENITHPLDNKGNPIESIVGYEILRGSREGQKTIVAKGLFNNMREFDIPDRPNVKGLFQNYPYNDLRADYYLTTNKKLIDKGSFNDETSNPLIKYKKNIFSFHSPETTFSKPFLSVSEIKIYQEANGKSVGYFENPYKHPKAKVIGQGIEIVTKVLSIIDLITKLNAALGDTPPKITTTGTKDIPYSVDITPVKPVKKETVVGGIVGAAGSLFGLSGLGDLVDSVAYGLKLGAYYAQVGIVAYITTETTKAQLTQLIYGLVSRKQYAAQYNSHGFYNDYIIRSDDDAVRQIVKSFYIDQNLQTFGTEYIINNLFRNTGVVIELEEELDNPFTPDESRNTLVEYKGRTGNKVALNQRLETNIASLYGAIKTPLASQYGQIHSVLQMPTFSCIQYTTADKNTKFTSDIIFGGDTYVNRFTEKNPFYFFNEWLIDMEDEFEYDYRSAVNIPYPRYWLDSSKIEYSLLKSSANVHRLNDGDKQEGFFYQKPGYFYLFCNGIRDFFVESEINLAQRDWGENVSQRHYDSYNFTDLSSIFRSDIIKSSNYYKYDFSLSVSKLLNNFQPWSFLLPRDYTPLKYESCFTYQPNRVTYSLQQTSENKKDNWRVFLTNNYRDFSSRVTCIKPIGKTGAIFMMDNESPFQFVGVDTLQTDAGTKLYIGDGGLLNPSTPIQSISNADRSYQYGSCQSRYAVLGSPQGVFWVSQNQGKIFQYAGQLNEISRNGMKWWFAKYLPSELLKVYPDYALADNPVKGVSVQMIYDNVNEIIYITKKDYKPKQTNLLFDDKGFYSIAGYSTVITESTTTVTCPNGYELINGQCVKTEVATPVQSGTVVNLTRTPYEVYGNQGTRVYASPNLNSAYTLLNTSNTFWIRQASPANWSTLTPAQKQAFDLNNGPVNRLSVWGIINGNDGQPLNNYSIGSASLPPVGTWIGFDICINIVTTKTYYVCIAADNEYRFSLDGVLLLSDTTTTTTSFNYLHIYPVTITAGSHNLRLEGKNNGALAGFGCEIFDLSAIPNGTTVVDYLNQQTNYNNLESYVIFTTRTASSFSSNLYSCPDGYALGNPTCNAPVCQRTFVQAPTTIVIPGSTKQVPNKVYTSFQDAELWEDASWTISYDPKNQMWLSFHDWKPTFLLPSKTHFMSVNTDSIWKHNIRCDLFCNFYGKDYPFDVEFVSNTGQSVVSVRNIEYLMEAYRYHNDCSDKFHVLDEGFDQAMIYNSEQVSGLLELVLKSKINPLDLLSYPQVQTQSIKIHYSKEENKYRFNEFWDITKNRGEFVSLNEPMFKTAANGYEYQINSVYVDYNKSPLERKRFRHNANRVWLRRLKSGDLKILFKLSNQKINPSYR